MPEFQAHPPLPLPPHVQPERAGEVWRVPYQERAAQARQWATQNNIQPAAQDAFKLHLVAVDVQNTFCLPDFELYVAGRSGTGAVDDTRRLAAFIYYNLDRISAISATMDTHQAMQIFHAIFLVNEQGEHPGPVTLISAEDVRSGKWKFNPAIAPNLGISPEYGQQLLEFYTQELQRKAKYDLTIWPYHAMLGGIGHALVSSFEEALFFHTIARSTQANIILKGDNPLTESYSVVGPELQVGPEGRQLGRKSGVLFEALLNADALVIAGEAKSHCVTWTISDLLEDIIAHDEALAGKVYLLEDCSSPVVVPGAVDYSEQADAAYEKFAQAGMHRVRSSEPIHEWPGLGG